MQKTTPSLHQTDCNCLALRQAARHVSQMYDGHLASEGLRTTQYSILAKLNRLGPLSINELAKSMVMDRTTLGRAIRPLERDRLLSIGAGDDGRTRSLSEFFALLFAGMFLLGISCELLESHDSARPLRGIAVVLLFVGGAAILVWAVGVWHI